MIALTILFDCRSCFPLLIHQISLMVGELKLKGLFLQSEKLILSTVRLALIWQRLKQSSPAFISKFQAFSKNSFRIVIFYLLVNSFGQGRHCVETWATICDQNNPIINLDTDHRSDAGGVVDTFYNDKLITASDPLHHINNKLKNCTTDNNNLQRYWKCVASNLSCISNTFRKLMKEFLNHRYLKFL